jgi:hypothetical protein
MAVTEVNETYSSIQDGIEEGYCLYIRACGILVRVGRASEMSN